MHAGHPTILILGANGMLGSELTEMLSDYFPVAWGRQDCDLVNFDEIETKILELAPNFIINAAGYTAVDKAEEEAELANKINGEAVGVIAKAAHKIKAPLIHFSTDYIFDGNKNDGYHEDDEPGPVNAYGYSKYLGEKLIRQNTDRYYIFRLAWLFGKYGKNFVDLMIAMGQELDELMVIDDQYGRPTYTRDVARLVKHFLENRPDYGIYHTANSGPKTTWYNLAKTALELKQIDVKIKPCTTEDYPLPAKRPKYSILNDNKLNQMPDWREALREHLKV